MQIERSQFLAETIAQWRRSDFVWGSADCLLSVCNYVRDVTGRDPGEPWRGRYDDQEGAEAVISAHGGELELARYGMALKGFRPSAARSGLPVVAKIGANQVAGLCLGDQCAFRAVRGVFIGRAPILEAWEI